MDNILVEELNLISLKVMFCKSVSMTLIATRYYNVWYDEMMLAVHPHLKPPACTRSRHVVCTRPNKS